MKKKCLHCGKMIDEKDQFCIYCGEKNERQEQKKIAFCRNCGVKLNQDVIFCTQCGTRVDGQESFQSHIEKQPHSQPQNSESLQNYLKKGLDNFTSTINNMTGEEGQVEIKFKELFSEVFEKHTIEEREEVFICGTKKTTPKESEMIAEWPKPWLFSRVFIMFFIVFLLLFIMINNFNNVNAIPGAIFIGAMMVPFSFLVFFWEVNVPRNISLFDVVSMFFIGGALSLICTLFLYEIVGEIDQLDYVTALLVGLIEEVGKVSIVAYYIKRKNSKYILNGMLIGACVGAGFAVFETAGYIFNAFMATGQISYLLDVLWIRSILSLGGHITWSAIAGVGLIIAKKEKTLTSDHILDIQFLKFLGYVIILHGIWDMPIHFGSDIYLIQWILTAMAVITVLVLLNAGLRQISQYVIQAKQKEQMNQEKKEAA